MVKIFKISLLAVLILAVPVLAIDGAPLKYPGNGIPGLSKDEPVEVLNTKIIDYLKQKQRFSIQGESITFSNVTSDIYFDTQCYLAQEPLTLKFPLSIEKGQIMITTGKIVFVITPTKAMIYEEDKQVFSKDSKEIKGVSINIGFDADKSLKTNVYILAAGNYGATVRLAAPAYIKIKISEGSTGTFGKIMWGRGYY